MASVFGLSKAAKYAAEKAAQDAEKLKPNDFTRLETLLTPERQSTGFAYPASQGADLAAQAFAARNQKFAPLNEQMIGDWARGGSAGRKLPYAGDETIPPPDPGLVGGTPEAYKRSLQQGFDKRTFYRGSGPRAAEDGNFRVATGGLRYGPGVSLAIHPSLAENYANRVADSTMYDVRARGPFMPVNDWYALLDKAPGHLSPGSQTAKQWANNRAKEAGFTGVEGDEEVNMFDPSNIRSTRAAFDPAKRGSSDLLASALLGTGLGAGALAASQAGAPNADAGTFTKVLGEGGDALRFHYGVGAPPVYPKGTGYAGMVTENDWRGSGMGEITARKAPGKRLYIDGSQLDPNLIGQGHGIRMYSAFADWAHANGYKVFSDSMLSEDSRHIYPALSRRGYAIGNVSRKVTATPDQTGVAKDDRAVFPVGAMDDRPIYKIGPKTAAPSSARFYAAPLALTGGAVGAAALGGGQGDADAGTLGDLFRGAVTGANDRGLLRGRALFDKGPVVPRDISPKAYRPFMNADQMYATRMKTEGRFDSAVTPGAYGGQVNGNFPEEFQGMEDPNWIYRSDVPPEHLENFANKFSEYAGKEDLRALEASLDAPLTDAQKYEMAKRGAAPVTAKDTAASRWGVPDPVTKALLFGTGATALAASQAGAPNADAGVFNDVVKGVSRTKEFGIPREDPANYFLHPVGFLNGELVHDPRASMGYHMFDKRTGKIVAATDDFTPGKRQTPEQIIQSTLDSMSTRPGGGVNENADPAIMNALLGVLRDREAGAIPETTAERGNASQRAATRWQQKPTRSATQSAAAPYAPGSMTNYIAARDAKTAATQNLIAEAKKAGIWDEFAAAMADPQNKHPFDVNSGGENPDTVSFFLKNYIQHDDRAPSPAARARLAPLADAWESASNASFKFPPPKDLAIPLALAGGAVGAAALGGGQGDADAEVLLRRAEIAHANEPAQVSTPATDPWHSLVNAGNDLFSGVENGWQYRPAQSALGLATGLMDVGPGAAAEGLRATADDARAMMLDTTRNDMVNPYAHRTATGFAWDANAPDWVQGKRPRQASIFTRPQQ